MKEGKTKVDIVQNRLYVTISRKLSRQGIDELFTDVRFAVADLKSGFVVVTDLSGCKLASLSGVMTFKRIMDYLTLNGVGHVIRIVNRKSLVLRQLLNLSARMQRYRAVHVDTMEEAESLLESLAQRDGLRFDLQQSVDYVWNGAEGRGEVLDMSTSGCAIGEATLIPSVGDTLQTSFRFQEADDLPSVFKLEASVVRITDDAFFVSFEDLDPEQKELWWKRLVFESKCDRT